jgi:hypothetical protein
MRSCHLENLVPFAIPHKNYETHRGAHKNDEVKVSVFIFDRNTLQPHGKCTFIRQWGEL